MNVFIDWVRQIRPEYVWIGYNSRPNQVQLPELSLTKTQESICRLKKFTTVLVKDFRGLSI